MHLCCLFLLMRCCMCTVCTVSKNCLHADRAHKVRGVHDPPDDENHVMRAMRGRGRPKCTLAFSLTLAMQSFIGSLRHTFVFFNSSVNFSRWSSNDLSSFGLVIHTKALHSSGLSFFNFHYILCQVISLALKLTWVAGLSSEAAKAHCSGFVFNFLYVVCYEHSRHHCYVVRTVWVPLDLLMPCMYSEYIYCIWRRLHLQNAEVHSFWPW